MHANDNRLLAALSPLAREHLLSACSFRELPCGTTLCHAGERPRYLYFLTAGIASVVLPGAEGEGAELHVIGREGLTSGIRLLGPASIAACCFVPNTAAGYRIRFADLEELFHSNEEVRARILEFVQHATLTISQVSSCNGLHQAQGRVARWILMAQDRSQVPVLEFTQEFLAEMLGLRRTTVTNVAQALQEADLITYSRGRLRIVDREGLEEASCTCYPTAQRLLRDLYRLPFSARSPRFPIQGESESFVARTSSGN